MAGEAGDRRADPTSKHFISYYGIHHAIGARPLGPARLQEQPCDIAGSVACESHTHHRNAIPRRCFFWGENALSVNALSYAGQEARFLIPQEASDNSDMECDSDEPDANHGGKKLGRDD